jgi:hypothetical protein
MPIVTTSYRLKRAPRKKRKQPAIASRIVTPPPLKKRVNGPVIRAARPDTGQGKRQRRRLSRPPRLAGDCGDTSANAS